MTLNDVKNDVASLGFEKEIELDGAFLNAVNRALCQIFTERQFEKLMRIYVRPRKAALYKKEILHDGGKADTFIAECRAFAFRSFGQGELEVSDGFGKRSFRFSGENTLTRAFVKGNAKFTFCGDFSYTVSDFTLYSELESEDISDLTPLGELMYFDPKKYDEYFVGFSSYPYDEYGTIINGSVIDSLGIGVKPPFSGIINIHYRTKPKKLTADDAESDIAMPESCEHLLSLLCAHYFWLDDDFAKSQHYLSLYRDGMSALKYYSKDVRSEKYVTNGWA